MDPSRLRTPPRVRFCTLAIHAPYRARARRLCSDAPQVPWLVLTDAPQDFSGLAGVHAIAHRPTGPMAIDFLERFAPTGGGNGGAAYHDKRFALQEALEDHDTAIFVDADSRIGALPTLPDFGAGISVLPVVRRSVAVHLEKCGGWRTPIFCELACELTGDADILHLASWCHETVIAITRDGREDRFFEAWSRGAQYFQSRGIHSGEGGVIGLAAAVAGWTVNLSTVDAIGAAITHEGGGPKSD